MTPAPSFVCGCCHAASRSPARLATRRGRGRPAGRGRHGAAASRARIKSAGAQHFVLGTDLGQSGNPTPADGLQMFVTGLLALGVSPAQIQTMGREVPGALLMG